MTLLTFSQSIPDFRINRQRIHTSEVIVYITLAAVICDAQTWEDVALFGRCKFDYFKQVFPYLQEIPSHDTFNRFFTLLKPKVFETRFREWVRSVVEKIEGVIAFDGKTIKQGSYDDTDRLLRGTGLKRGCPASKLHIVSAWYADFSICLSQMKVEEKTNEITAIPELIEEMDILGCIITTDAMGCQKEIARTIIKGKADYVLAVKENHKHLYQNIKSFFDKGAPDKRRRLSRFFTSERAHAREEERECIVCDNLYWLDEWKEWPGLNTFVCIHSTRISAGVKSKESRYYISSLGLDAEKTSKAIRTHWSIENNLHWQLDVTFNEDDERKKNNAAQNFSLISKVALTMLKNDTSIKASMKTKRKGAGWDNRYLHELLSKDRF